MKRLHLLFAAASLLLASSLAQAVELPGPLVTPQWLAQHKDEVNIVSVLEDPKDFTAAPKYVTDNGKQVLDEIGGHIPGSLLLDFGKLRGDRTIDGRVIKFMIIDRAAFQALMQDAGLMAGKPIVIVSEGASGNDLDVAARTFWSLKYYGAKQLAILNGGTTAWLLAGNPISTDPASMAKGNWVVTGEDKAIFASSQDVADAHAKGEQLVDARSLAFFEGLTKKPVATKAGHIAGAVVMPPEIRTRKVAGAEEFMTPAQYDAVFKTLDINPRKPTITYCNTGHLASGAWFVLNEILGVRSKVYDGSMHEWTAEDRPVVGLPNK